MIWRAGLPVGVGLLIALVPVPAGLDQSAWYYVAVFSAVIVALITEPLPPSATGFIGVTVAAATGLPFTAAQRMTPDFRMPAEAVRWALSGFSNGTVWLIFAAFMFAMGYEKTGLGRRLALLMVKWLGHRALGLGYAVALSDLLLAPVTPSNTARSAGMVYPVIRNIPELYGVSRNDDTQSFGTAVMWIAFATTCITSSMFVTALAPNLFLLDLARTTTGVVVTWTDWVVGFLPMGVLLLLVVPWLTFRLHPPDRTRSTEVPRWAASALAAMGPVSRREIGMASLALLSLTLWIFASATLDPTLVAMIAVSLMLATGIVSWEDVLANAAAWNVLVWFATLVVLADGLNRVGVVAWLGTGAAMLLSGVSPMLAMVLLVALFFLMHYAFASITAHAAAVTPVFLAAGAAIEGMPIRTFVMLLGFSLGVMGVLTPYATGPAPLYYGCGFIGRREFWRLGLLFGMLFLATLLGVGVPWLQAVNGA
jgi:L-tartrate/succinate antiporter